MFDIKKLNLKVNKLVDSLFIGNYKAAFKGRGLEFSDYINYDYSSDSKFIDWVVSKREQKLLVKRFQEERELVVFFLLDISSSMNFGEEKTKIDTLIETFYILSFSAISNNDRIGAMIFNDNGFVFIKPGKGKINLIKILNIVKDNKIKSIPNFNTNKLFSFFNSLPIRNSLVFLLTDKIDEIDDKYLKIQSLKNDFVYINIFDYFENNLINDNSIVKFGNKLNTIFINLRNNDKIEKYRLLRKQKIDNFRKKIHKFNGSYLFIDNTRNIFKELLKFFKTK